MILKIDHVGVVANSGQETVELFSQLFGFREVNTIEERNQGFLSRLITTNGAGIEVISPIGPKGDIARFLHQKGGGVHHLSFEVDNIENEADQLIRAGVRLVNAEPHSIDGLKVIFVHPESMHGLLIELVEKRR